MVLTRPNMEPLECSVGLYFDEPREGLPRGPRKEKESGISIPAFKWIRRDDWGVWNFDEFTVATVDEKQIRVNRNCIYLEEFKRNRPSVDGDKITAKFGVHVSLTAIMLYYEFKDEENSEILFKKAISAVGKSCLPLAYDVSEEAIEKFAKINLNETVPGVC